MSSNLIIPYLWNPSTNLKRETKKPWKKLEVFHENTGPSYLFSRSETNTTGKFKKNTSFNPSGAITSIIEMDYPDEQTEITQLLSKRKQVSKDIKKFNSDGFLQEHIEESFFIGFDVTKYFYNEKNQLIKIFKKEEDGDQITETFTYKNNKLFKIETENSDGGSLFRGYIYDKKGLLEKVIRMQNNLVNMEVKYFYNAHNQIIKEIHESVNRLKDRKNSLMITEYDYYPNGVLKEENFSTMDSYKGKAKFTSTEYFDEKGLSLKTIENDLVEDTKEIYLYKYETIESNS